MQVTRRRGRCGCNNLSGNMPFLPLWVELFRDGGRELVDGCGFSEIDDAVEVVRELVEKARRLHDGS